MRPPEEVSKVMYLNPTPNTLCHSVSAKQKESIAFRCRTSSEVSTFPLTLFPLSFSHMIKV